jgi:hypothetical protein
LLVNGTISNTVEAFTFGRLTSVSSSPSGTIILNNSPVVLPAEIP